MKRFLSLVLAIELVFSSFTIICKAAEVNEYSNSSYDADAYYETAYTLYDGFMTGPCWAGYLADKKNFVYPQVKDKLADNGYFQACLSAAEFLTNAGWADLFKGEYDADDVKVQYYVTALCSLLMTMEDNWENIRASQSKVDATMTWNEYAAEGASAVAGLLAENTNGIWETAFTVCGISVDIIGNSIDTVEDYQSLEAGATTFLMYHRLLETIINNTSDDIMSQAAKHLLKVTDLSYTYRMNYLDTTINAESDYFFSVLDKVLEDAEKSNALSPEEFAALGCMNRAAGLGGSFKVGIDIGKFVMDAMIHSSDTILRYYEMCAMASVRDALIIEITKRNSGILGQQDWEEILTVRDLLMDLLYVNVRGEYCAYNLLAKDAGLISSVHNIFNGKEDIEWIRGVLSIADNLQRTIKGFFPDWEDFQKIAYLVASIEFEVTDWGNYAKITAYSENNDTVWVYETPQYEPTELPRVSEIGEKDDKYYFIQDRTVMALDIQTGTIVWENNDFGGSRTGVALGENAIYLCGQYGPDFYAISYDGNTLARIEQLDPNYYWASEIELLDRQAAIYLHGGTDDCNIPMVFFVDLETYSVSTGISINSSEPWKNAYVKFINEQDKVYDHFTGERRELYKLVNINNDNIPELYINFGSTAGGDMICTYYDNSVQSQYMWNYGFSYIEGQNLFIDSGGRMDEYYDIVYSIIDGKFVEQCHGEYGAKDNANIQIDADGQPIHDYFLNKAPVTQEEYASQLNSFYDKQHSISPFDGVTYDNNYNMVNKNGLCNYQEIIDAISNY